MSLYRQAGGAGGRTLALIGAGALLVGLVAGFVLGRSTASEPTLSAQLVQLRRDLQPADSGIELSATEYAQAVRGGRVVAPTEYKAAQADIRRAEAALDASRAELQALSPERAGAVFRSVSVLRSAVSRRANPEQVRRL